jgi:hypothetical protein
VGTKRVRRARHGTPQITPLQLAYLMDDPLPPESEWTDDDRYWWWLRDAAALWRDLRDQLLPAFVKRHPGRRPRLWWNCDAPRQSWPGKYYDGKFAEPRQRLGGIGTPKHEVLANVPAYDYGIPVHWVDDWEAAYYNGRALDVHAKRIGTEYRKGGFKGVPIDPNDPPIFESQAAYLGRHGLLLPGERKRLTAEDFEPEAVTAEAPAIHDHPHFPGGV